MIKLNTTWDTVWMLVTAFGVGAIGGLAAELLEVRGTRKATGTLELWHRLRGGYVDIGFPANVLLGAIAAVGILYFFAPTQETVKPVTGGGTETIKEYDLIKLVALSLIVGSAGARFLAALQTRALALVAQQQAQTVAAAATAALESVPTQAAHAVETAVAASPQVHSVAGAQTTEDAKRVVDGMARDAASSVQTALTDQVQTAKDIIAAVGPPKAEGV